MRYVILNIAALAVMASAALGQATKPTLDQLSAQAAGLEKLFAAQTTPAERRRVLEDLEKVKHQMGPFDAAGARVRCQAMWHDSAIDSLETEIKRLKNRPTTIAGGPVIDLRLHTRTIARACLVHGWRIYDGPVKYQVDAFGEYLVDNSRTLDALYDSVGTWAMRAPKLPGTSDEAAATRAALDKAKQGIAQMGRAADALAAAPSEPQDALVPMLAEFLVGLQAVREADLSVREHSPKKEGAAAAPAGPSAEAAAPEPPAITAEEKERLAKVREVAARLKDPGWGEAAGSIERFAAAVETGFAVASARPKARELLATIEQAAVMIQAFGVSKAATPEYLKMRQAETAAAFLLMADPGTRARGYARIAEIWQEDGVRRQFEPSGLTPAAVQGLVRVYYITLPALRQQETAASLAIASRIARDVPAVAETFGKLRAWPPQDMTPFLKDYYARQLTAFRADAEKAGAIFPADAAANPDAPAALAGVAKLDAAAAAGGDLELLVRAETAAKAVSKQRPARAQAIFGLIAKAARELLAQSPAPAASRQNLESIIQPLEEVGRFSAPDADLSRAVQALVGRSYAAASAVLNQEIGAGIDAAATGNPLPLRQALAAQSLFALLKHRAAAATYRLDRVPVANLAVFSIPASVWTTFMENLDQKLRTVFTQYAAQSPGRAAWVTASADLDAAYQPVAAAQRLTLDSRIEGESDLDLLMRNLERAAAATPATQVWNGWAVGYHVTEAAVAMNAGFDTVAAYHRGLARSFDAELRTVDLAPAK